MRQSLSGFYNDSWLNYKKLIDYFSPIIAEEITITEQKPDPKPEPKPTTISKKEEIIKITDELKSHYFKNEFFVDPDNKFIALLQKITVI